MAKIIKNDKYVEDVNNPNRKGLYLFDPEDGSPVVELTTWVEERRNGNRRVKRSWIRLPKGNITNRQLFSEKKFTRTAVDGVVEIGCKKPVSKRVTPVGVKRQVLRYLDKETIREYIYLVSRAVLRYKDARSTVRKKRPSEMGKDELKSYIEALRSGRPIPFIGTGPKSFIEMFTDEEYERYNEILSLSIDNKLNGVRANREI